MCVCFTFSQVVECLHACVSVCVSFGVFRWFRQLSSDGDRGSAVKRRSGEVKRRERGMIFISAQG